MAAYGTVVYETAERIGFRFRFVYRNQAAIEMKAYDRIRDLVLRDYAVFSGKALESYFAKRPQRLVA